MAWLAELPEEKSTKGRALGAAGIALLLVSAFAFAQGGLGFPGVVVGARFGVSFITYEVAYHVIRILLRKYVFGLSSGFGLGAVLLGPIYELIAEDEGDRRSVMSTPSS